MFYLNIKNFDKLSDIDKKFIKTIPEQIHVTIADDGTYFFEENYFPLIEEMLNLPKKG